MQIGDYIAVGILIFFVVLGLLGSFKWILQLVSGLLIGALILCCIAFLIGNPKFDSISKGVFEQGSVFPYLNTKIKSIHNFVEKEELISKNCPEQQRNYEAALASNMSEQ